MGSDRIDSSGSGSLLQLGHSQEFLRFGQGGMTPLGRKGEDLSGFVFCKSPAHKAR